MADKVGRPKGGRNDVTVKIDADLLQRVRMVATHRKVPLNRLLCELLDGPSAAAHAAMLREMTQASQPAEAEAPARPGRRRPKAP